MTLPTPVIWLSTIIDRACLQIFNAWEDGRVVRGLRVNPSVYDVIAAARPYEVARGDPLLLLDLELIPDSGTATHDPVVVTN